MPAASLAAAATGLPEIPPRTYGQSVTELAKRYHALTALYPLSPWVDDAMDHICTAAEIIEKELFRAPATCLDEVAVKLRILADKAADGSIHDCADCVRQVADEWEEAYHAELMLVGLVSAVEMKRRAVA